MNQINKDIEIEDLVNIIPEAVSYLRDKNIRCLRCGEPIWGSLESACKKKGYNSDKIDEIVSELNILFSKK